MHTLADSRRYWLPQLVVLVLLAGIGTLPFWLTDLDIRVAAHFYHPEATDPWPVSRQAIWLFFYQAAPLLVGLVTVGSLAALAAGSIWPRFRRLRLRAVFVLATAILGPGLIVNALLKDHWGRPRPHQTVELGGTQPYLPPLAMGEAGKGKSFPCGHASAGFMLGALFFIWRRRRPVLAYLALAGSLGLGAMLGIGRMTAGDHYLSDVIWAAVITYGLAWALYYFVLRIPQREDAAAGQPEPESRPIRHPIALGAAYAVAAAAMILGVLLATPVHQNVSLEVNQSSYDPPPRTLRLIADQAQVTLSWHPDAKCSALILLKGRGFGLPGTRVEHRLEAKDGVLTFSVAHQGVFTERDSSLIVAVAPEDWDRLEVVNGAGDIRVYPLPPKRPKVAFETGNGEVLRDVQ